MRRTRGHGGESVPREEVRECGLCGAPERAPFYPAGDIVECARCGVLYVSPRPTDAAIEQFYSADGHYAHWDEQPGRTAMWARRLERVSALVPSGRLLDVGAGQGDFPACARARFDVDGTEISSEGVRVARERHGVTLRQGDLLGLEIAPGSYDVITVWHVLEHVGRPGALLAKCASLLRPGGVLVVAVPNTDAYFRLSSSSIRAALQAGMRRTPDRSMRIDRLELARPEEEIHLTHFTLRTLSWAMQQAGLDLIDARLDDHSANHRWRARAAYYTFAGLLRATGAAVGPAIYAAARKPTR